jgi:hypothetical protein
MQGMKDMYEWIHLMAKSRLLPISIIRRLEHSQPSSLTGHVQNDLIGRSISPRPQYCYYSTPLRMQWRPDKTLYDRPSSSCSNENGFCLNYRLYPARSQGEHYLFSYSNHPIYKEQKIIQNFVSHVKNNEIPLSHYDRRHTRRTTLKLTQKYPIYLQRSMSKIKRSNKSNFPEKYFDNLVTLLRESASNLE